jgi:hypothetical protein
MPNNIREKIARKAVAPRADEIDRDRVDDDDDSGEKQADDDPESDLVWGAENIGRVIGRTKQQVYHLVEIGALDGAAAKLGHKTIVGSRKQLGRLPLRKTK